MKYSLNLLKHFISINDSVENIADKITLKTVEVEEILKEPEKWVKKCNEFLTLINNSKWYDYVILLINKGGVKNGKIHPQREAVQEKTAGNERAAPRDMVHQPGDTQKRRPESLRPQQDEELGA